MSITKDTINGLIHTIQNLYLSDNIPWLIGYSGGKDSTATVQLVWLAIEQLPIEKRFKNIFIMNTDTLVESPVVSKWVEKSLEQMKTSANNKKLPFIPVQLIPSLDNTFWVNLIGRGYPFPRMKYRWCTSRLKIDPVNKFIQGKIAEHGEVIMVIGTRKAESVRRARTMEYYEKKRVRELLSPNPSLANELVFSPLEAWTNDDVWTFLMQYKNPWNYSNMDLLTMYRGATKDNECPIQYDNNLPSCGKSRFGCWVCTMVEKDKSMEAMIANDDEKEWMTPLLEFRNEFGNTEGDRERRSFRKMNGTLQGNYGQLFHGPYNKETREKWLKRLLEIQKDINENGPEEFSDLKLIRFEELQAIRNIWVKDKHEFDDSLPRIYKEVTGSDFEDPDWISSESFRQEEWDTLKKITEELYPDEELAFEMMYSLIDIENNSSNLNKRKDVLEELDKQIGKTFYKNEKDALEYFSKKMNRKKDFGGKYTGKFLEEGKINKDILNDSEEEGVDS